MKIKIIILALISILFVATISVVGIYNYVNNAISDVTFSLSDNHKVHKSSMIRIYDHKNQIIYKKQLKYGGLIDNKTFDNETKSLLKVYFRSENLAERFVKDTFYINIYGLDVNLLADAAFYKILENSNLKKYEDSIFYKFIMYGAIKKLQNRLNINDVYINFLNNLQLNDNVSGFAGSAEYLYGKDQSEMNLREKLGILLIHCDNCTDLLKEDKINDITFKKLEEYKVSGLLSEEDFKIATKDKIRFKKTDYINKNRYFVDGVLRELSDRGIKYSDINIDVHSSFDDNIYDKMVSSSVSYFSSKDEKLQTAIILADYRTGKVKALLGAKYGEGKLNRALSLKRQIGSVFKPIVYLTAFNNGIKPEDMVEDKQYTFGKGRNAYSPRNFDDFYMGNTFVKNGLIHSLNNATIMIGIRAGLVNMAKTADLLGLYNVMPYPGSCLGVNEYTVYDVANVYSGIANNGKSMRLSFINKIKYIDNGTEEQFHDLSKTVVSEYAAENVKSLLAQVVKRGTARGSGLLSGTIGKTGTSNDYKDAWFAGIYYNYVIVTWVGRDDHKSMGEKGTGGGTAAPFIARFQKEYFVAPAE